MKVTYYVATSVDGFIATVDGGVSWLDEINIEMTETGYGDFFASIDCLVMGRHTYDFVFDYGSWPYGDKPTWICTSRALRAMEGANLRIAAKANDVVQEAKSKGLKHLWLVGGGKLASSFLENGLLTHLSISEMPVNLGAGIPVFADHKLEDLSIENTEVLQKRGFKQIEISLHDRKIT